MILKSNQFSCGFRVLSGTPTQSLERKLASCYVFRLKATLSSLFVALPMSPKRSYTQNFEEKEVDPASDLGDEGDEAQVPGLEIGGLGARWEESKVLRRRMKDKEHVCMTRWVNANAINVASVKAMVLNATALTSLAK